MEIYHIYLRTFFCKLFDKLGCPVGINAWNPIDIIYWTVALRSPLCKKGGYMGRNSTSVSGYIDICIQTLSVARTNSGKRSADTGLQTKKFEHKQQ